MYHLSVTFSLHEFNVKGLCKYNVTIFFVILDSLPPFRYHAYVMVLWNPTAIPDNDIVNKVKKIFLALEFIYFVSKGIQNWLHLFIFRILY